MIIDKEFVIEQPVGLVFSQMADIEKRPQWVEPAQSREKMTEGAVGVGTQFRAVDMYPDKTAHFTHEITVYEPNRVLSESWDGPMAGTGETLFVDEGGSTRVNMHMEMKPLGLLGILAPLMKPWAGRAITKDVRRLEEIIASDSP